MLKKNLGTLCQVIELSQSFYENHRQRLLTRRTPVSGEILSSMATALDIDALLCHVKEFVRAEVARKI